MTGLSSMLLVVTVYHGLKWYILYDLTADYITKLGVKNFLSKLTTIRDGPAKRTETRKR